MSGRARPLFTIAIPTYKRDALLRESVCSCLAQTCPDFELLIGNDDPDTVLVPEMFGNDPRIRIINRSRNLGALGNMNALIQEAGGVYFVWLSDDDAFMPDFLMQVERLFASDRSIHCVYTSFYAGSVPADHRGCGVKGSVCLPGAEFLRIYLEKECPIQGWYGVFETGLMRRMGGMRQLGTSWFSPHADLLFPIQAAAAGRVGLVSEPLVFLRTHEGSVSTTSVDVEAYASSQQDFFRIALPILSTAGLQDGLKRNVYLLMKWCLDCHIEVMRRSGRLDMVHWRTYWAQMSRMLPCWEKFGLAFRLFMIRKMLGLFKNLFLGRKMAIQA